VSTAILIPPEPEWIVTRTLRVTRLGLDHPYRVN
jgi:hypothetical protein